MKRKSVELLRNKVLLPLGQALKKGISIKRMSVSLALGITIGLIPFYGITTVLVGVIALSLRLNFAAMQVAHYIVHPLQIALIIPFLKLGSLLSPGSQVSFTISEYMGMFKNNFFDTLHQLWLLNLSAIFIWLIIAVPLFILLYKGFEYSLKKYAYLLVR